MKVAISIYKVSAWRTLIELNEQIDTCLFGTVHIGGYTANRYIVEQFVATYAHHVHRHLTGNELYAKFNLHLSFWPFFDLSSVV